MRIVCLKIDINFGQTEICSSSQTSKWEACFTWPEVKGKMLELLQTNVAGVVQEEVSAYRYIGFSWKQLMSLYLN